MREEHRQRLAKEYDYAANKMREAPIEKKLFYFSVLFGEAKRMLNVEWDGELALIHSITQHAHAQINSAMQSAPMTKALPMNLELILEKLNQATTDLATYYEKQQSSEIFWEIMTRIAEITYAITGNGSYLLEKGILKL